MTWPFLWYHTFSTCDLLTVTFDLILKNFNIGHYSFVLKGKTSIFGIYVPYDEAFPIVSYSLNMWP